MHVNLGDPAKLISVVETCSGLANPHKFITLGQSSSERRLTQVSVSKDKADFETARSACEAEGARLAELSTEVEAHLAKVVSSEYHILLHQFKH